MRLKPKCLERQSDEVLRQKRNLLKILLRFRLFFWFMSIQQLAEFHYHVSCVTYMHVMHVMHIKYMEVHLCITYKYMYIL